MDDEVMRFRFVFGCSGFGEMSALMPEYNDFKKPGKINSLT